ncbi:hypothetical protein GALL_243840 [mine drainage metagenome]|uniref:Uncharacterized protein n=1 Tax=mine drainage metagenome TaxID=410659 RepID=A0A1J5S027_9ZZZZ
MMRGSSPRMTTKGGCRSADDDKGASPPKEHASRQRGKRYSGAARCCSVFVSGRCVNIWNTSGINTVRSVQKIKPDSRGAAPGHLIAARSSRGGRKNPLAGAFAPDPPIGRVDPPKRVWVVAHPRSGVFRSLLYQPPNELTGCIAPRRAAASAALAARSMLAGYRPTSHLNGWPVLQAVGLVAFGENKREAGAAGLAPIHLHAASVLLHGAGHDGQA